jgi:hypothetical protein
LQVTQLHPALSSVHVRLSDRNGGYDRVPGKAQRAFAAKYRSILSMPLWWLAFVTVTNALPAAAQVVAGDVFADGKDGAKIHVASGFVCPAKIGLFERDAVGEFDPQAKADFCAYSALDGVYGTIRITPVAASYDPKISLAHEFAEQEATGGKKIAEGALTIAKNRAPSFVVYTRSYETAELEELHYRVLFAGAEVKPWAIETTIEYAAPRDAAVEQEFLRTVYETIPRELHGD